MKSFQKIFTYTFLLLITSTAFAQKIKVKKGEVLLEKTPIASIETLGSTFNFSNLGSKDTKFLVKFNILKLSETVTKKWLTVSTPDEKKTTEVEMEYFSVTMSNKKAVAEYFFKKYKILTKNGIDENVLADFFAVERQNITDQNNEILKDQVLVKKEIANLDLNIDYELKRIFEGTIPYTSSSLDKKKREMNEYPNMLGRYRHKLNVGYNGNVYSIIDLDGHVVAIASPSSFNKIEVSLPYKKEKFIYESNQKFSQNTSDYDNGLFVKEIVGQLYLKGIYLGHQLKNENKTNAITEREENKQAYEQAQKESINIFKENGFVIEKNGLKTSGELTAYFENIKSPTTGVSTINESEIKKTVKVVFTDVDGKKKYKKINAKSKAKFCVDGGKRCYRGLKSSIVFLYAEILSENDIISLYKSINSNNFYIKTPGNDKPMAIYNNKPKTISKISEYLNCEKLDNDEVSRFDFEDSESILSFIDLYKNSCKQQ